MARRDRLVVRTLRCGRSNPGSNPGLGSIIFCCFNFHFIMHLLNFIINLFYTEKSLEKTFCKEKTRATTSDE